MGWTDIVSLIAVLSFTIGIMKLFLNQSDKSIRELLTAKLKPIEKQLDNHVTVTDKKIDKLTEGQNKLAEGQNKLTEGQASLEAKLDLLLKDKK